MKHIYKYTLEILFFKIINSKNKITKNTLEGAPIIEWIVDENTTTSWLYEDENERDNDYNVIMSYY